jgi:hypothetical protein
MSKVDFHRNTFLEIEELNRFQKFMVESNVNKTFLSNTINWGIIDTSGGTSSNDFKVEAGTNSGTVKIANLSRALQKNGLLIEQQPIDGIAITNDSAWYWLKIGHTYTHLEEGSCSISVDGSVVGLNTKFTEVLRGVSSKVPVKVMFTSANNTGIYDVVNVIDDLNIIIQGDAFVAESGVTYRVLGSTPLGETVTSEQQTGLYSYDSCTITKVAETVSDTPPAGLVEDEEFWIARVSNTAGTVTIQDKREYTVGGTSYSQYWEYYIRGVSDKLNKNSNLLDVANKEAARGNLGVYSITAVDNLLNITSIPWTLMNKGAAATNSGFDVKICRIGSTCTITGEFTSAKNAPVGSIVASLPWAALESPELILSLTNNIHTQVTNLSDNVLIDDKELFIYVEARGSSDDLQIKTLKTAPEDIRFVFTLTFNLI